MHEGGTKLENCKVWRKQREKNERKSAGHEDERSVKVHGYWYFPRDTKRRTMNGMTASRGDVFFAGNVLQEFLRGNLFDNDASSCKLPAAEMFDGGKQSAISIRYRNWPGIRKRERTLRRLTISLCSIDRAKLSGSRSQCRSPMEIDR